MNNSISKKVSVNGFTLIEIVIVVAIVGILAAISYPAYQNNVEKSRRSDGKGAAMDAAARQEQWYFQHNRYTGDISDVGGNRSSEGYYSISIDSSACSADGTCFNMVATGVGAQANDQGCKIFTVDQTGSKKSFSDSVGGTDTTADCW